MIKYKYPSATQVLANDLKKHSRIILQQLDKHANLLGDHHYQITNENNFHIAHASEQLEGLLSQVKRLFLNLHRSFDIRLYNSEGEHAVTLRHHFRWIYKRLEIYDVSGKRLGTIKQVFTITDHSFNVEDSNGKVLYEFSHPYTEAGEYRTFKVTDHGRDVAKVQRAKFTFTRSFELTFQKDSIDAENRLLILIGAIFVDLFYFESH